MTAPYPFFDPNDEDEAWKSKGLCSQTDPEAFFPERGESPKQARKVCQGCEVKDECLDYAIRNKERFGVWGGLSERERAKLVRLRRRNFKVIRGGAA